LCHHRPRQDHYLRAAILPEEDDQLGCGQRNRFLANSPSAVVCKNGCVEVPAGLGRNIFIFIHQIMVEDNTTNNVMQGKKEKKQLNLTKQHKISRSSWSKYFLDIYSDIN